VSFEHTHFSFCASQESSLSYWPDHLPFGNQKRF
jgi:hypothetical protein